MSDFGWRLSSDFRLSDYDQRLSTFWFSTIERLSDYDQRLSRSKVSDYGWRLSDYDRPPSFRVEVRRFSDLLIGWMPGRCQGGSGGLPGPVGWPDLEHFPAYIMYSCRIYKKS